MYGNPNDPAAYGRTWKQQIKRDSLIFWRGFWTASFVWTLFVGLLVGSLAFAAEASETTVLVSVKAHHFQHDHWEQWNPGLSIERRGRNRHGLLDVSLAAGIIRDSLGNWSPHVGAGLHYPMGRWSVGLNAVLLYRQRNLAGDHVGLRFAPLPSVEWKGDVFGVGLVLIPKPSPAEKDSAAVLLQLRVPL